jgi:hypothetical protein
MKTEPKTEKGPGFAPGPIPVLNQNGAGSAALAASSVETGGEAFTSGCGSPMFEGMAKHPVLCFWFPSGSLPGRNNPCGTDFYAPVGHIDVHESFVTDNLSTLSHDCRESHRRPCCLLRQNSVYVPPEANHCIHEPGKLAECILQSSLSGVQNKWDVFVLNQLRQNYAAFQRYRRKLRHR